MELFVPATGRQNLICLSTILAFLISKKGADHRLLETLNQSRKHLARVQRLGQPETETAFRDKSHFFFSRGISCACAAGCAHCRSNGCAFSAAYQSTQQRATAGPAANECQVSFLITTAAHKHAVRLQRYSLAVERDGRQSDAQISGVVQVAGLPRGHYLACYRRAFGRQSLSIHHKRFVQLGRKTLPGLRRCTGNGLL